MSVWEERPNAHAFSCMVFACRFRKPTMERWRVTLQYRFQLLSRLLLQECVQPLLHSPSGMATLTFHLTRLKPVRQSTSSHVASSLATPWIVPIEFFLRHSIVRRKVSIISVQQPVSDFGQLYGQVVEHITRVPFSPSDV